MDGVRLINGWQPELSGYIQVYCEVPLTDVQFSVRVTARNTLKSVDQQLAFEPWQAHGQRIRIKFNELRVFPEGSLSSDNDKHKELIFEVLCQEVGGQISSLWRQDFNFKRESILLGCRSN